MNQSDFRITAIQRATVNGRPVKIFTAHRRIDGAFVHVGQFSAPVMTANCDLWDVVQSDREQAYADDARIDAEQRDCDQWLS